MQAPTLDLAAQLQVLRHLAHDNADRDIAFVRAWRPGAESSRELADWLFVAAQVLTVAELSSR
jgi:hypothetical protein